MPHSNFIRSENLAQFIFFIRGEKVLLDFHLAALYEVETRALKQQVKRNLSRFPEDFMFQLSKLEWDKVITICDNLGEHKYLPAPPSAFTEQGVAMLSGILRSKKAIEVNIAIMRAFVQMRKLIDTNKELSAKIDAIERKYDDQFKIIFEAIRQLIREDSQPRKRIGFKIGKVP